MKKKYTVKVVSVEQTPVYRRDIESEPERRTRRFQCIFPPSLYIVCKQKADMQGIPFNEYIIRALEDSLEIEE